MKRTDWYAIAGLLLPVLGGILTFVVKTDVAVVRIETKQETIAAEIRRVVDRDDSQDRSLQAHAERLVRIEAVRH